MKPTISMESSGYDVTIGFDVTTTSTKGLILRLNGVDIAVIVVFFVLVLAVGVWSTIQANRSSVRGYFLAGKNMLWWPVGLSIFASNMSSNSFIGLAGSGADSGVAVGFYELSGVYCVILLGWLFLPVYLSSGIYTMPEYMKYRFGGQRIRTYLSCLSLVFYILTQISTDLYSGAIFIQQSLGWQLYPSILALLAVTTFFAATGGLRAVIYTDAFESLVMIVGAFVLMILSFIRIGGYEGLVSSWNEAIPADTNGSCGMPNDDAFKMFRSADNSVYPWTGMVFGITILGIWNWCTDQVQVQRSLAAKNLLHAKGGSVLAGALKILPLFLMVLPGMISRILFPDEVACVTPEVCKEVCQNPAGCTNIAYPKLVIEVMPQGFRGLMIAAIVSALMSSLTSVFNSAATIFTVDIWKRIRTGAGEREMTVSGRIFVLILTVISVAWIPILSSLQDGKMFEYLQSMTSYVVPPICSTYLLAVLWPRMNEPGAFWGLIGGFVVGVIRMLMDFTMPGPFCGGIDTRPYVLSKVAFLNFAVILFLISASISVVVSLLTQPVSDNKLSALTWWTRFQKPKCYGKVLEEEGKCLEEARTKTLSNLKENKKHDVNKIKQFSTGDCVMDFMCGSGGEISESQVRQRRINGLGSEAIKEDPKWRTFINVTCLITLGVTFYIIGYFS